MDEKLFKAGIYQKFQITELLNSYTKEELKIIARIYSVEKLSSYTKKELVKRIEDILLMPENAQNAFLVLRDDEINAFEKASEFIKGYPIKSNEKSLFGRLFTLGYIGMNDHNEIVVPEEVIGLYKLINTNDFHKRRQRVSWLLSCFDIAAILYGVVPVDIMVKVFNQGKGRKTDSKLLLEDYESIPGFWKEFELIDKLFIHHELLNQSEDYKSLLRIQGDKQYYIPTENEIMDIAINGFLLNDPYVKKLIQYFTKEMKFEEDMATELVGRIQSEINVGCRLNDVFNIMNEADIRFENDNEINKMISLVNELWNNTRMLLNRGYKPVEL